MEGVRQYLIGITAAALVCGIAVRLVHKGLVGAVVKLMAGVFMALAVAAPLVNIKLDDLTKMTLDIHADAEALTAEGENSAREAIAQIISGETAAYILDKAEALGASVTVTVYVSSDAYPVPTHVRLEGSVSPYARLELNEYISANLGIEAEEIEWIP